MQDRGQDAQRNFARVVVKNGEFGHSYVDREFSFVWRGP